MTDIAFFSDLLGAGAFLVLVLLLLRGASWSAPALLLLGAALVSAGWFGAAAWMHAEPASPVSTVHLAWGEVARDVLWLSLLAVLSSARTGRAGRAWLAMAAVPVTAMLGLYALYAPQQATVSPFMALLIISLLGLVQVEQLFRATRPEHRWTIKFLCLGVGGLFAYDFFMYSQAVLFGNLRENLWVGRGAVNALCVPFIAVSIARNRQWRMDIFVSRHVVFHSTVVLAGGLYLIAMALGGYYLREFGGSWGTVVQAIFLFGAAVLLLAALSSGQLRARLRVFLVKHFYRNKYDYREEWLAFTQTLSRSEGDTRAVFENVVAAIARMVEARGGVLWLKDESGQAFTPRASQNMALPETAVEPHDGALARFLTESGWIIEMDQLRREPEKYGGLEPPAWLAGCGEAWLVVPLLVREDLLGFVVLAHSPGHVRFDWEDSDLLKTVGRQTASYLALLLATDALSQARQFEAFNRLSAFLVHDLKNVVAQLSLVGTNAKRFKSNPEFVSDAFETVEHAVAKMSRMLGNLQKGQIPGDAARHVDLAKLARAVVTAHAQARPVPVLELDGPPVAALADPDRVSAVLSHLVQNAQEATPDDGEVKIRLSRVDNWAVMEVSDTGCGMEPQFVRERLFKPFDTTKGNAGMGIGAFESREIAMRLGGTLQVQSTPGAGTTFTFKLPVHESRAAGARQGQTRTEVTA